MSTRRLSTHEIRRLQRRIIRILPNPQRISRRRQQLRPQRLLRPLERAPAARHPLQARCRIPMTRFNERREVWIVSVIVFYQDAFVLEADDGDSIAVIFGEGRDSETEG